MLLVVFAALITNSKQGQLNQLSICSILLMIANLQAQAVGCGTPHKPMSAAAEASQGYNSSLVMHEMGTLAAAQSGALAEGRRDHAPPASGTDVADEQLSMAAGQGEVSSGCSSNQRQRPVVPVPGLNLPVSKSLPPQGGKGASESAVQMSSGSSVVDTLAAQPSASTLQHWELTAPVSARLRRESSANSIKTVQELEDEYELDDLDSDWRQLLGDVDVRLLAQGARKMSARERSVAIKKLLNATGTRGVDFALNDALREVLAFRLVHA
jgi:hypothetical protein